ncbi:MAG: hypothetical protein IPP19_02620 [Verrucomicrobia bacterium]|nr:hypothetical protein [Verrucomicrobiota bacterium]
MKLLRPILWSVAVLAALTLVIIVLAFNTSVQTWAARRALANQADMKAGVGRVSAGLKLIELNDIKIEKPGMVLNLPSLTIEMPLASAAGKNIAVKRLVAKGWKVDLSVPPVVQKGAAPATATTARSQNASSSAATTASKEPFSFDGVLKLLRLPVDFSLDEIDVEGEVTFQAEAGKPPSRATVRFTGGNLKAGGEGRFNYVSKILMPVTDAPVSELTINSVIVVLMDTPRTLQKVSIVTDVKAIGQKFPQGADLHSELVLNGGKAGEAYLVSLQTPLAGALKNLFSLDASFPAGATSLSGKWKMDVSNADVAPFTLGLQLPVFSATGEGAFEADRTFSLIHTSGRVDNTVEQLAVIIPELTAVGRIRNQLDFDLSKQGDLLRIERFSVAVSGNKPIASVQALQKFDYDLGTRALKVTDPSAELLRLTLHGLPLAWAQPFLKDIVLSGDDVRGEFFVSARNGGFAMRPSAPITITNLNVSQAGKPLVRALDIAVKMAADSTQQGWQADISELFLRSGSATLLSANVKAGCPAGDGQPIKATGRMEANLPALLAQPVAAQYATLLNQGVVKGEFTANIDTTKQISANFEVSKLGSAKVEKLPLIQLGLRVDLQPDGQIVAQIPLTLDAAGRKSDIELAARVKTAPALHIEADVLSNAIYVQDLLPLQALAASLQPEQKPVQTAKPSAQPAKAEPKATAKNGAVKPEADKLPFWNACTGLLKLALKEIVYSPDVKVSNVTGQLKIEAGAISLENIKAGLGAESAAALNGTMTFEGKSPEPYTFSGEATVTGFDPAPYFKAANPQKEPTVEGKFDVVSKLSGIAPNAALLASKIKADLTLSSRGGVFRGLALPKAFSDRFQGKSGSLISNITGVVGALAGGSKTGNAAAAAIELASLLALIPFDQLNVQLSHDANAALTRMSDFTLISPTIRLTGSGTILQQEGVPLLKQPLTAQFEMSSHGHVAELFGKQGMLQGGTDTLGYSPLFTPIKVDGTLAEIGTDALMNILLQKLLASSAGPLGNLFGK